MRIVEITQNLDELRRYFRAFVPSSPGAEMICAAFKTDVGVKIKAAVDERGIAAAISYMTYPERTHVFMLGSIVRGAGSLLMSKIEQLSHNRKVAVTVSSAVKAEGYYLKRGYVRSGELNGKTVIHMILPYKSKQRTDEENYMAKGAESYRSGGSRSSNPYHPSTEKYTWWDAGWTRRIQ